MTCPCKKLAWLPFLRPYRNVAVFQNITSHRATKIRLAFHFVERNSRIGPRETWLSPCSIWRSCVTTVSVRFEFIKVCMGTQRFCWKSQFCLYFVNKIYFIPCCCVVLFCLPAPQADLTRFWRVIVRWASTAKQHWLFQQSRCVPIQTFTSSNLKPL